MSTVTDRYCSGPETKATGKSPELKGGTVQNGLAGKEPMYASRDKYVARDEQPTDRPTMASIYR